MTRSEIIQVIMENPNISAYQLAKKLGVSWWQCRRLLSTHKIQLHLPHGRPPKSEAPASQVPVHQEDTPPLITEPPRIEESPPRVIYKGRTAGLPSRWHPDNPAIQSKMTPNEPAPLSVHAVAPVVPMRSEQTDRIRVLPEERVPMELLLILLQTGGQPFDRPPLFKVTQRANLGRDPHNEIPIVADSAMSRVHATAQVVRGRILLRDLGSTNGTFVNGVPISVCALHDGDEIRIGNSFFLVQLQSMAIRTEPAPVRSPGSHATALADWRHSQGMTQIELARRLDVSQRAVSMWENGHSVSHDNQVKLRALGFELAENKKD